MLNILTGHVFGWTVKSDVANLPPERGQNLGINKYIREKEYKSLKARNIQIRLQYYWCGIPDLTWRREEGSNFWSVATDEL